MTREEAQQIRAAHKRGEPVADVDLWAAIGALDDGPVRNKRLPLLPRQNQINRNLVANMERESAKSKKRAA